MPISFLWPIMLWLLLAVPALGAAYVVMQRRRQRYALRYASLSMVKEALGRGPGLRRHIPAVLFLAGLAVMITALARPTAVLNLPSHEGIVILTIDVSRSMEADDIKPNRLEAARAAALEFVDAQPGNVRLGVVSFSGSSSIVQLPTSDKQAVKRAIAQLTSQNATAIGRAILTSLAAFYEKPGGESIPLPNDRFGTPPLPPIGEPLASGSFSSAIIVLLSDGQSNSGPRPMDVIGEASSRGIRVYTVGLGSPTGTIIRFQGRAARVFLDEETLKAVAQATGGEYFHATSETHLRDIYHDLGTRLVFKKERTELTAALTGAAVVVLLVAGGLSLLWFNRLP